MVMGLLVGGSIGTLVGLWAFCVAVRRMDDIWHRRRAWAPRLFLISATLLAGSGAMIYYSLLFNE